MSSRRGIIYSLSKKSSSNIDKKVVLTNYHKYIIYMTKHEAESKSFNIKAKKNLIKPDEYKINTKKVN